MFIVLLRFAAHKDRAAAHMEGHKAWIQRGFDDGVFLMSGSLRTEGGGGVLAHDTTLDALRRRVAEDPFVTQGVVTADIVEIDPARTDARLGFLAA
ncbi:MAG: hypothetical protein KDE22_10875 [Rhodobacterales bacterium]|nr:hypothetical protein [Rhodobacterales bacterium]